jgi:hypothetical protein
VYYRLGTARFALVTTDRGPILRKAGADGPRVGDTKVEGGTTLRFNQNHRWEKVESVAPGQLSWVIDDDLGLDDMSVSAGVPNVDVLYEVQDLGDRSPELEALMAKLKADLDAGTLDYDDDKWDDYPFELFERAAMELGIA